MTNKLTPEEIVQLDKSIAQATEVTIEELREDLQRINAMGQEIVKRMKKDEMKKSAEEFIASIDDLIDGHIREDDDSK